MNESRIAEFRNEANTCTAKAEAATDATAKRFYTGLANGWLELIIRLERDTPMPFKKIAEYNEHAEKCSLQSELTGDADNKLHWLAMAEGWRLLADSLGKKDVHGHISLI